MYLTYIVAVSVAECSFQVVFLDERKDERDSHQTGTNMSATSEPTIEKGLPTPKTPPGSQDYARPDT